MRRGITRLQSKLEEVKGFEPTSVTEQNNIPHVEALAASVEDALERTFGRGTTDYDRYKDAAYFDNGPFNYAYRVPITEVHKSLARSKARSIALLEQAIRSLQEQLNEIGDSASEPTAMPDEPREHSKKVFIVHGHEDGPKQAVARFLTKLGLEPIILHEQPSRSRTIIEKIEEHGDVGFAVVLLTPDDEGRVKGAGELEPRARQNVIAELGYFVARLKRERVCALVKEGVEIPSDFSGVVYVPYDDGEAWQRDLGRELQAAGYAIDWNKVMGH
jgi:predicted nucleotide-binding protein